MIKDSFIPDSVKRAHISESLRTWQIVTIFLLVVIGMLSVALVVLMPLKETETHFVQFTTSDDVYFRTVSQSDMTKKQRHMLERKYLRQYVSYSETRDTVEEMGERFKTVRAMSSSEVFDQFKKRFDKQKDKMDDVTREVLIISDTRLGDDVHQIEFKTIDRKPVNDGTDRNYVDENLWFATIRYTTKQVKVNDDVAMRNPLNIKIQSYQITSRDKEAQEKTNNKQNKIFNDEKPTQKKGDEK